MCSRGFLKEPTTLLEARGYALNDAVNLSFSVIMFQFRVWPPLVCIHRGASAPLWDPHVKRVPHSFGDPEVDPNTHPAAIVWLTQLSGGKPSRSSEVRCKFDSGMLGRSTSIVKKGSLTGAFPRKYSHSTRPPKPLTPQVLTKTLLDASALHGPTCRYPKVLNGPQRRTQANKLLEPCGQYCL